MAKEKLPKELVAKANAFVKTKKEAAALTNQANREKTAVKSAVKSFWSAAGLPIGSYMHVGGLKLTYSAVVKDVIDPELFLELYENEEITREQFLACLSISKIPAANAIGGDQVAALTVETVGTALDIRTSDLPVEEADDEFVFRQEKIKTKKRRKRFGGADKAKAKVNIKTRRRIKVKR